MKARYPFRSKLCHAGSPKAGTGSNHSRKSQVASRKIESEQDTSSFIHQSRKIFIIIKHIQTSPTFDPNQAPFAACHIGFHSLLLLSLVHLASQSADPSLAVPYVTETLKISTVTIPHIISFIHRYLSSHYPPNRPYILSPTDSSSAAVHTEAVSKSSTRNLAILILGNLLSQRTNLSITFPVHTNSVR